MLKALGYAWRVLTNLVGLLAVFYILSRIQGHTEALVVPILVLIYATIRTIGIGLAISLMATGSLFLDQTNLIKKIHDLYPEDQETINERRNEQTKTFIKYYIDLGFLSVLSLSCLYVLFAGA